MEVENIFINAKENKLIKIKSDYFLQMFFNNIPKKISLEIIKYNKNIQKRLNLNINNYKEYSELYSSIEIEIIPMNIKYGQFIHIKDEKDEKYYHIYFNNDKEKEAKKQIFICSDGVSKINIIIDYQVKSLNGLFSYCELNQSINFKKFHRKNIDNMCYMFYNCKKLKEINLSNINTNNVTNMSGMFQGFPH